MENLSSQSRTLPEVLEPLPYHQDIVTYLKKEEAELWQWFASNKVREKHSETVRLELLKSNYRIESQTQPHLYEIARDVLLALHLDVPITFYQASGAVGLNAALNYLPHEAHIVFFGPIVTSFSQPELKALLAHELAHFAFFDRQESDFLVAAEILTALNNDASPRPAWRESERLFRLYTEIFADRAAILVTGDPLVAVSKLLKVDTGLAEVSPESYLRQADEILSKGPIKALNLTHPETFIRAKAMQLFAARGTDANEEIQNLIEGAPTLQELDILGQKRVAAMTRKLISHFLAPPWLQSELVLAHARSFFADFVPDGLPLDQAALDQIKKSESSLQEYFAYVLLDFVSADRQLEEAPLAAALLLGEQLGIRSRIAELAQKELNISTKKFAHIDREAEQILDKANRNGAEL